jgi:hypothetical protein
MVSESDINDEHMDMWQSWCESGRTIAASHLVYEGNTYVNISGGNAHFTLINSTNDCTTGYPTILILRYNKVHNIGSRAVYIDANAEHPSTQKNTIYNNTFSYLANGKESSNNGHSLAGSADSSGVNNIHVDSMSRSGATGFYPGKGWSQSYNLYYSGNGTISFGGAASSEVGAVKNRNPLLANPGGLDFSIPSNSPARNAGGPLTVVADNDGGSGTTLIVTKAEFFSWGWGIADADWIAVGTPSNAAQISTINYDTNAITLASSISRKAGDSVWLYKKSDGKQVLYGNAPDIGAYEFNDEVEPPGNVRLITP